MPISTDLSAAPFFDDYNELKDYYKVLFRPGRAVQTRELNQLQTILQKQVERFGDNIFKSGTIIDGCNLTTHEKLPYVKLRDFQTNGLAVDAESYKGLYVRNSSNLSAYVVESVNGFEASNPHLNTLYLKYINSGNSGVETAFAANQQLTIYDPDSPIFSVTVANGSVGFSNNDSVIITNAVRITNSVGGNAFANGFYVGDYISNGLGANVQIVNVKTTLEETVLTYKPIIGNLMTGNAATWRIEANNSILNGNTAEHAVIKNEIGSGLSLSVRTDTVGKITRIDVENPGSGYKSVPYLSIYSTTANSAQVSTANVVPLNYKSIATVANNNFAPIGHGYGVSVGEGIVYLKGQFLRVSKQLAIVSKYEQPNDLALGFATAEETWDSNDDLSLLDNSTGSATGAPGADRLKLTPYMAILSTTEASANSDFLTIMEFKNGYPYKQVTQTQYDVIEDNLAKRTLDTSGNFTLDKFLPATASPILMADEADKFNVLVDTGVAYINGHRIETKEKYIGDSPKGKVAKTNAGIISTNYGSYVRVNSLGGNLPFGTNETFDLRDTATSWTGNGAISLSGSVIGNARIRSIMAEDDFAGIYRVYLFDINMNPGTSFNNAKCINFSTTGVANFIQENGQTNLRDTNYNGLIFSSGLDAVKSISNVSYTYRTNYQNLVANTTGFISKTLTAGERFPQTGTLSTADELSLIVIAKDAITSTSNQVGSATTSTTSQSVTGVATTFSSLNPGDWIKFANSTSNSVSKILSISNNTFLTLTANAGATYSGANLALHYPAGSPINLQTVDRTANVSTDGMTLTVSLGHGVNSANVDVIADVISANTTPASRTVSRDCLVRLDISNNAGGVSGPWCLGVTDIIRLKGVYKGSNNTFTKNTGQNITSSFYIDSNQGEDYLNSGYLMPRPNSGFVLATGDRLLVEYDCLLGSDGVVWIDSYPVDDTKTLANSVSTINTMEIPELWGTKDAYYDLRDCIDFRPRTINTANVTSNTALVTINPSEPSPANRFSNSAKKYPNPSKTVSATVTYYNGRKDTVVIDENGTISILHGDVDGTIPKKPQNSILIDKLTIPAYPSIPAQLSGAYAQIIDTKIANEKFSRTRFEKYSIKSTMTSAEMMSEQPKGYTMADIGGLERRINDLEYYVSFTLQEAYAKDKSIPSAANAAIERFKFGYFVDPFDDDTYADRMNPGFSAEYINSKLVPPRDRTNIKIDAVDKSIKDTKRVFAPYEEFTVVTQPYATTDKATNLGTIVDVANNGGSTTTTTTVTSQVVTQRTVNQLVVAENLLLNANGKVAEVSEFYMSSTAGPAELYYNFRNNRFSIEVYQGDAPNFTLAGKTPIYSSSSAVAMTTTEQNEKAFGMGYLDTFFTPIFTGSPTKPAVAGSGKMVFTHSPANGRYYKVVVTKYYYVNSKNSAGDFSYRIWYPTDTIEVVSTPTVITVINTTTGTTDTTNVVKTNDDQIIPTPPVTRFNYDGGMITNKDTLTYSACFQFTLGWEPQPVVAGDSIECTLVGMKPNTSHEIYANGVLVTAYCQQGGRAYGGGVVTGADGTAAFTYYFDPLQGINIDTSWIQQTLYDHGTSASASLRLEARSSDNSSTCTRTIGVTGYTYGYYDYGIYAYSAALYQYSYYAPLGYGNVADIGYGYWWY